MKLSPRLSMLFYFIIKCINKHTGANTVGIGYL